MARNPWSMAEIVDGRAVWRRFDDRREVDEYAADGVTVTATVPYTAEENAAANERALEATEDANQRTVEEALDLRMSTMQAIIDDTNSNINSNPAARIKDIARAVRLLIRQARGDFDGTT